MHHEIKTIYGTHIVDQHIRDEVNHMIREGIDTHTINGKKIEIVKDYKTNDMRETIIQVEE